MKRALIVCAILLLAGLIPVGSLQAQSDPIACPGTLPSRLVAGEMARVLPGLANNRRAASSQETEVLGLIPGGAVFDVIDGPVCHEGYAWWQVAHEGLVGWTVEGDSEAYWTEPLVTITPDNAADVVQMAGLGRDGDFIGFSPDRRTLAMTSPTGVQLFDVADFSAPPREIDPLRQIYQAVFSPDWRLLATVGRSMPDDVSASVFEPGVRVFNVATGQLVHEFEGAGKIGFSPDGFLLYSYSPYRSEFWSGHVWDTATFEELSAPEGYPLVLGMAWNNTLLAVDTDGMVWQWDPRRGAVVGDDPFFGPIAVDTYVLFSAPQINPAGTLLFANVVDLVGERGLDQLPTLWELTTGTARYTLDHRLVSLDWESGLMVREEYTSETGPGLVVVDIATGRDVVFLPQFAEPEPDWVIPLHMGGVEWMAVNRERSLIALMGRAGGDASCGGEVGIWELATGRFRFTGYPGCVGPVLFHPVTGELMYTRTADDIQLWNPADNLPYDPEAGYRAIENRPDVRSIQGGVRTYARVVFGAQDGILVAADTIGHLHAWDTTTWRELPDQPELSLWDVRAGQEIEGIRYDNLVQLGGIAFSPVQLDSGGVLVAATLTLATPGTSHDPWLYLWDSTAPAHPLATLPLDQVSELAFSPDGARLAYGRRILDVPAVLALGKVPLDQPQWQDRAALASVTRVLLATEARYFYPTRIVFSPDGTELITLGDDEMAIVWDAASGQQLQSLKPPGTERVSGAAYSPDGRLLAVTTGDDWGYSSRGYLYLFDAETYKLLAAPEGHRGAAWDVAFSPDGRLIASAGGGCTDCESYGWDDAIRLWYVDPDR